MQKWVRANYQPPVGEGINGERVTGCAEHIALSKRAATEGMVLLKNNDDVLPLKTGANVVLFGKATIDYVKGGGGSGDVNCAYVKNLYDGMKEKEDEGKVNIFMPLVDFYQKNVREQLEDSSGLIEDNDWIVATMAGLTVEPEIPENIYKQAVNFSDTAIISICRYSGEDWDRVIVDDTKEKTVLDQLNELEDFSEFSKIFLEKSSSIFERGDFYLTNAEEAMIKKVTEDFDKVIVVLNVGGMVDTSWFSDNDSISSALLSFQAGMEGGAATADILVGDVCPSGRLTDTFAKDLESYPSTEHFHDDVYEAVYDDDIFVGYRYFETIPGAKEKVNYPFGYGLSYTDFEWEIRDVDPGVYADDVYEAEKAALADAREDIVYNLERLFSQDVPVYSYNADEARAAYVSVEFKVTNTGDMAGKDVIQLYFSSPKGKLDQPAKVLGAFKKTRELKVGESQVVTLTLKLSDMASYDSEGVISKASYVLEQGDYQIMAGADSDDTFEVMTVRITENAVVEELTNICKPLRLSRKLNSDGTVSEYEISENPKDECVLTRQPVTDYEAIFPGVRAEENTSMILWGQAGYPQLIDVYKGKITLDEFIEALPLEDLIELCSGHRGTGISNTGAMGSNMKYGIPAINSADGPAGLRIGIQCMVKTTAFPCATLLAATWNEELVEEVGRAGAKEVKENNIGIWLTPAVCIHRSPLCGRNFEYYSEDPYLTGKIGAAMVRGIQSQHVATSVKHFCCNNKETNRKESDSILSERALREIYLKGFEIIVKESDPWTIMSSYNKVNGVSVSENYDLLTTVLRDEWGFKGMVTTDWWNHGEQYLEIKAGNDIKMMNGYPERVMEAYEKGAITKDDIKKCAKRVAEMILKID